MFCSSWLSKAALALLLSTSLACAWDVELTWDPPADTAGIAGYELHYGPTSGVYSGTVSVPGPSADGGTVPDLDGSAYIVARSVGTDPTQVSGFSNEVYVIAPGVTPADPIQFVWRRTFDGDQTPEPTYFWPLAVDAGSGVQVGSYGTCGFDGQKWTIDDGVGGSPQDYCRIEVPYIEFAGYHYLKFCANVLLDSTTPNFSDARIFSQSDGYQEDDHVFMVSVVSGNTVRVRLRLEAGTDTYSTSVALPYDTPTELCVTLDLELNELLINLDGQTRETRQVAGSQLRSSGVTPRPAIIGGQYGGSSGVYRSPWNGDISNVRLYLR